MRINPKDITIKLHIPTTMYFDDYHDMYGFVDQFNKLISGEDKLKYPEIQGESNYGYVALLYFNKQDKAYKLALKEYKDSLMPEIVK